jgi:hypothetical protein
MYELILPWSRDSSQTSPASQKAPAVLLRRIVYGVSLALDILMQESGGENGAGGFRLWRDLTLAPAVTFQALGLPVCPWVHKMCLCTFHSSGVDSPHAYDSVQEVVMARIHTSQLLRRKRKGGRVLKSVFGMTEVFVQPTRSGRGY